MFPFSLNLPIGISRPWYSKSIYLGLKKACGPDKFPARSIYESSLELALLFACFASNYLMKTPFPLPGKNASISAILKQGAFLGPKNQRAVSITSVFVNLFGKKIATILAEIQSSFQQQHGFQRRLSCRTQLDMVIHEGHRWLSRCDLRLASYPKWYRKVYNGTCIC